MVAHTNDYFGVWANRSYLAVDVFFILSGFVIAHAYEQKLKDGSLSFGGFFRKRIIRLYPMYLLSLALASVLILIAGFMQGNNILLWTGYTALLTSVFITRFSGDMLFTLNPPYWSLFYELLVNFLYAAIAPFLTTKALIIILVTSASVLFFSAFNNGHLNIGFGNSIQHYIAGMARSVFGIMMGVLLYRIRDRLIEKVSYISPWVPIFVVISALLIPKTQSYDFLIDFLIITLLFPVSILIASQFKESRFNSSLLMLGAASYPLYVIHYPISKFITTSLDTIGYKHLISEYAPFTGILLTIFLVILSLLLVKFIENPVRAWLNTLSMKKLRLAFSLKKQTSAP
jgi:peptidoglycan/LPS O-acetylase OafA/YrhL